MTRTVSVGTAHIGGGNPLALIAGPCIIENETSTLKAAEALKEIASKLSIPLIFKSSYDKANRSSISSYRGPGLVSGLKILSKVKETFGIPLLSDVHRFDEIGPASEVLDCLQVPAFLCRQTDFVVEVARTGKAVNVKKGQFLAPWDMKNVIEKVLYTGNNNILLTERGASFGYNNLVVDFRALPIMRSFGYPVVFDATHSVQLPGGKGTSSGGQREFVGDLARAAVAVGVDAVFMEVHEDPEKALCDGPNSIALKELSDLLGRLKEIERAVNGRKDW
ncbi:MAG: 3-deoxy-8-phosphooctulonate synthase [Deltaproteobacteria bacterium]|nr:3-deoxy-8-phosphooctulonate synthase [Deltaproteobacteria bacterium]